jgi:hypothetical protein
MSKRAAIIITDCDQVEVTDWCAEAGKHQGYAFPSEQLLADLRVLVAPWTAEGNEAYHARARVRALLPEEDEDESV